MKERPILFSAPMVRAILDGRKTQTRRIVRMPDNSGAVHVDPGGTIFGPGPYLKIERTDEVDTIHPRVRSPYGYAGDRLWVRETWCEADADSWYMDPCPGDDGRPHGPPFPDGTKRFAWYRATDPDVEHSDGSNRSPWRPSIFMPRWASRITLEITEVRVQRLQEITEADARAEGCRGAHGAFGQMIPGPPLTAREDFERLWDSINGKRAPWASNPWVWAYTFRRIP